jgi:hypothetical protein
MSVRSPGMMNTRDSYLRTAVFAAWFDEHGCSSVRLFSEGGCVEGEE